MNLRNVWAAILSGCVIAACPNEAEKEASTATTDGGNTGGSVAMVGAGASGGAVAGNGGSGAGGNGVGGGGGVAMGGMGGNAIGAGGGGPCDGEVDGAACYACCANQLTIGRQIFEAQFGACGCGPATCYLDCNSSICGALNAVDSACVGCIEAEVAPAGSCGMAAGFQNGCLGVADCDGFVACVTGCTP